MRKYLKNPKKSYEDTRCKNTSWAKLLVKFQKEINCDEVRFNGIGRASYRCN